MRIERSVDKALPPMPKPAGRGALLQGIRSGSSLKKAVEEVHCLKWVLAVAQQCASIGTRA